MAATVPWVKFADPGESDVFAANCFPVRGLLQSADDGLLLFWPNFIPFSDLFIKICYFCTLKRSSTCLVMCLKYYVPFVHFTVDKLDPEIHVKSNGLYTCYAKSENIIND